MPQSMSLSSSRHPVMSEELHDAIRTGNLVKLRKLVSPYVIDGHLVKHSAVTRQHINIALFYAVYKGCVESCRILWKHGLGKRAKQGSMASPLSSLSTKNKDDGSNKSHCSNYPLHSAVCLGRLEIVRLFVQEFRWNVNQANGHGNTPLSCSVNNVDMTRFLLQNGANANGDCRGFGGGCEVQSSSPLLVAVHANSPPVVRLLLEHGADPNLHRLRSAKDAENHQPGTSTIAHSRCIDIAIQKGNPDIVSLLIHYGALVERGFDGNDKKHMSMPHHDKAGIYATSLNHLLCDQDKSRETKLVICRRLVEHSVTASRAASFLKQTLRHEINERSFANVQILVEAGVEPTVHVRNVAICANQQALCHLLLQRVVAATTDTIGDSGGGIDPFKEEQQQVHGDAAADDNGDACGISPFHTAARQVDTAIFASFLTIWKERFSAENGSGAGCGKNENGEYPIHAICRDKHVSLEAVQFLLHMERQQPQARRPLLLASLEKHGGCFPFEIAAMSDASIDVIYTLFQHCTDAVLREYGM
jgi:ankyrin repeat protein